MTRQLASQLKVFTDTKQLSLTLTQYVNGFQRQHKFTLGTKIINECDNLYEYIILSYVYPESKEKYLTGYIVKFELLKVLVWKAGRLHQLSLKQEAHLAMMMEGIGKQITAWKNAPVKMRPSAEPGV